MNMEDAINLELIFDKHPISEPIESWVEPEEADELWRTVYILEEDWHTAGPAHTRFRRISVELFSELADLCTTEVSRNSLTNMVKSCEWGNLRTFALKTRLTKRLEEWSPPPEVGTVPPDSTAASDSGADLVVGDAAIPARAIVRFLKAGFTDSQIIEMWQGEITAEQIAKAAELVENNPWESAMIEED